MFTFAIFNNGREVDNLDAGTYPTEALARDAGLVALDDLCPLGSPNRGAYRVEVRAAAKMSENMEKPGFTPGPYHCNAIARGRVVGDETARAERYEICNRNAGVATVYRPKDVPLFKAAPDLYAALEEMTERYAALDARLVAGQHSEPNGTIARARAALSRAKGGV